MYMYMHAFSKDYLLALQFVYLKMYMYTVHVHYIICMTMIVTVVLTSIRSNK